MSELEQMYREVILDHYKSPRGHGLIEDAPREYPFGHHLDTCLA